MCPFLYFDIILMMFHSPSMHVLYFASNLSWRQYVCSRSLPIPRSSPGILHFEDLFRDTFATCFPLFAIVTKSLTQLMCSIFCTSFHGFLFNELKGSPRCGIVTNTEMCLLFYVCSVAILKTFLNSRTLAIFYSQNADPSLELSLYFKMNLKDSTSSWHIIRQGLFCSFLLGCPP